MLFNKNRMSALTHILQQTEVLLAQQQANNTVLQLDYLSDEPIYKQIIDNLNRISSNERQMLQSHQVLKQHVANLKHEKIATWACVVRHGNLEHPDTVCVISPELRQLLGYRNESDLSQQFSALNRLMDNKEFATTIVQAMQNKERAPHFTLEHLVRYVDGQYRWVRTAGTVHKNTDDSTSVIASMTEIHNQKLNTEQLADYYTKHELINKVLVEAFWDMTVEKGDPVNPNNEFWWSPQFRQLLGFKDEKDFPNIMSSWSDRLHPEDKEGALQAFTNHLLDHSGRTPFDVQYRLKLKSGDYHWFHATGETLRDAVGSPLRVAGIIRDITAERNKAQYVVIMNEKFEQLSQAIEGMAKGINLITGHAQELAVTQEFTLSAANTVKLATDQNSRNLQLY
ncbi:MAG: PAS domain-containing protein [Solibacillus sp.]